MTSPLLFLFFALLAATLDNLGQGFQKGGIAWIEQGAFKALVNGREWPAFRHWLVGLIMSIGSPFVLLLALKEGPANLTAALGVFGLIPLYVYAGFVLGEIITRSHKIGLVLILVSTLWVGWKSLLMELPLSRFQPEVLGWILLVSLGGSCLWSGIALWQRSLYLGFALGTLAGVIGGLNLLMIKWGALFRAWWTTGAVWFVLAVLGFAVLQLAYVRSNALQVVSANTAIGFIFPMLASPLLFSEPFPLWLIFGMLPSILAVWYLTQGEWEARQLSKAVE